MDIHRHTVSAAQPPSPIVDTSETFVDRDKRAFSSTHTADLADDAVRLYIATTCVQTYSIRGRGENDSLGPKNSQTFRSRTNHRFIHDTKVRHDVPVLGLGNELGKDANVVEPTLGIGHTHDTAEEVDGAESARVVPPVLRAGQSVQVEVDAETVLARPLNGLEEVLPGGFCIEWLAVVLLDGPEWEGNTDEVEARAGD